MPRQAQETGSVRATGFRVEGSGERDGARERETERERDSDRERERDKARERERKIRSKIKRKRDIKITTKRRITRTRKRNENEIGSTENKPGLFDVTATPRRTRSRRRIACASWLLILGTLSASCYQQREANTAQLRNIPYTVVLQYGAPYNPVYIT